MEETAKEIAGHGKRKLDFVLGAFFSCLFLFVLAPHVGHAATLYFSPSSGSYVVGNSFSVGIYVNSSDQASNAYSGTISFSEESLEVTGISKSGSIMSLWVQEPSYSNASGTVSFEGVVLNPGYSGSGGAILTVTFRAKAVGSASVAFTGSEVLANDGFGTSILTGVGNAAYTIVSAEEEAPQEEEVTAGEVPGAPTVTSSTHPVPEDWYAISTAEFSWKLPSGTTGVNVLADQEATTNPGTRSDGVFSTYSYNDVEDGVWYFHIRLRNSAGWGETAHFRFQIDTESPTPTVIEMVEGTQTQDPQPSITLESTDATSGIEAYVVVIDGKETLSVDPQNATQASAYQLPLQSHGIHTLAVHAIDAAGNESEDSFLTFTILSLDPPQITERPLDEVTGRTFRVGGTSYPNSVVTLVVTDEAGRDVTAQVQTDELGGFRYTWRHRFPKGAYTLKAFVTDARGAVSEPTIPVPLYIGQVAWWSVIAWIGGVLSWIVMSFTFILLMLVLGHFARRYFKWFLFRYRKRREENEKEHKRVFAIRRRKLRAKLKAADRLLEKSVLHGNDHDIFEQILGDFQEVHQGYRKSRRHKH